MSRLKAIGLALVAVLVLSAISAASASANFQAESSPMFLKGEQGTKNVFTVSGGTIKCSVAVFTSGEIISGSVTSVSVHPSYSGCTAFGQSASVNTSSCNFVLSTSIPSAGSVSFVCSAAGVITVSLTSGECSVTINGHTPSGPNVSYSSEGGFTPNLNALVLVFWSTTGITYNTSGGACGSSGINGSYSGTASVKAFGTSTFGSQRGFMTV